MKWIAALTLASIVVFLAPSSSGAQGAQPIGVTVAELKEVVDGWSAKKHILGKPVYNDTNEKIGAIDDIIVSPDTKVSYAIVGTGGFVGLRKHDVAVPMKQLQEQDGKLVLPGATKETRRPTSSSAARSTSPTGRRWGSRSPTGSTTCNASTWC